MTTGDFTPILVSDISVDRDKRQRRELRGIPELASSIQRNGLIHPILVRRKTLELVAGERRLEAHRLLGWTHIQAQFEDEKDPAELRVLELEENIRRENLPWAEQTQAIDEYHRAQSTIDPTWTREQTAEVLGVTVESVQQHLTVAKAAKANPVLLKADKFSSAVNVVRRVNARQADAEAARTQLLPLGDKPPEVLNISFHDWAPVYSGPKFTFIHCDFPYGINADNINQGTQRAQFGEYADSEDVYWSLLETFAVNLNNFCADTAHLMFWYSMKFHTQTIEFLRTRCGFIIDDFPLIWHKSDSKGLLPDPQRGPRRVYETALFGRRGDRKVVIPVDNACSKPTGERDHMSQKPEEVLRHFFRMTVDENTDVLDPTCGSGTAIAVAKSMKAGRVLGLEIDKDFSERATRRVGKVEL